MKIKEVYFQFKCDHCGTNWNLFHVDIIEDNGDTNTLDLCGDCLREVELSEKNPDKEQ